MTRTPYLFAATAASLVAGAAIGATLLVPSSVNAAQTITSDTTASTPTTAAPTPPKHSWVDDALKPLVDAGTITQAQADAVKGALAQAKPAFPGGRKVGPLFGRQSGMNRAKIAGALGITEDDLRAGLAAGKSLADLAKEHGKDPAAIVQVIIDDLNANIDAAVTAGKLTPAQADQMKADAKARAQAVVNALRPLRGGRRHLGGVEAPGDPGLAPAAPGTAPTTPTTVTS